MVLLNNTCYNITFKDATGKKLDYTKLKESSSGPGYLKYNNTNLIIENSDSLTTSIYEYTNIKNHHHYHLDY